MGDMDFWRGKRVLVTGHTGFKGSWLALWLSELGAEVTGLALPPETKPALHHLLNGQSPSLAGIADIRDRVAVAARVLSARPQIVFHLAAQPLVRAGYREPLSTFETNVQGTVNLLEALRIVPDLQAVVVVTTDKVYENPETGHPFVEADALGGHDPYSASKAAAEIVVSSYRRSYFAARGIGVATARAGNVIGGGDWAEDRLIPDAIRAWERGETLEVRRPQAVRPWQHVLEPLAGYLRLAEHLTLHPTAEAAFNFGPDDGEAATVGSVIERARQAFGAGAVRFGNGEEGPHEAGYLMLDSGLAARRLDHRPRWGLGETVDRTIGWYRALADGGSARQLCLADIAAYGPLKAADAGARRAG